MLCFACLPACGDDGSVASDDTTSGTSSGGPTTTTEPGTLTSIPTGDTGSGSESTRGDESSSSTGAAQLCGNGVTDDGETCDDGNTDDDDSCSEDCLTATCLVPITHESVQAGADDAGCPTVWIIPGTYVENLSVSRDVVFERVLDDPVIVDGNGERTVDIGGGDVTLRGLTVIGGEAGIGGGILADNATVTLDGTLVDGNNVIETGGGVYVDACTLNVIGGSAITNNLAFDDGEVGALARGGGIAAISSVVTISGSTISDNEARADLTAGDGFGGFATAGGGGLWAFGSQVFVMADSVVSDNTAFTVCLPANGFSSDFCDSEGGGIHINNGALVVADSAIEGNTSHAEMAYGTARAGGLLVDGDAVVSLTRSSVSMNRAEAENFADSADAAGGGIAVVPPGNVSLQITETTGNGNTADSIGVVENAWGGFLVAQPNMLSLLIERCTFEGNTADDRGGFARLLQVPGNYAIVNSTISGNTAAVGGAIAYQSADLGTFEIDSSSITLNAATGSAGALWLRDNGTLSIRNTILYGNTAPSAPDCLTSDSTSLDSRGYNFIGSDSGCQITGDTSGNQIGVDPELGALMDNGGPTFTHALEATSPATNAGNPTACVGAGGFYLATDQRGELRHAEERCDVGAYEYQP